MEISRNIINLEENIGKQVGRRRPPTNPLQVASNLNVLANNLIAASGHKLPPRGVFRFRTHQEADQWMITMGRKKN